MSKIERVAPAGGRLGSTPGGGGSPSETRRLMPKFELAPPTWGVSAVDCRNGGFWALDDDVPPGVKFQNLPTPPRTRVRPVPSTSHAKPTRGPMSPLE